MLIDQEEFAVTTSWTNGRKAIVHLLENTKHEKFIMKVYRRGFLLTMFREYFLTKHVARRLPGSPRVLAFRPRRRELFLSYVSGQRVLEWVLERFGDKALSLHEFQSLQGVDPDHPDPRVAEAFRRLRESTSAEARRLKDAIRASYSTLHGFHLLHGSPDPRNMIYDGSHICIIDFDHARPSFNPAKIDYRALEYWYGLSRQH
jgi:hypothetical protein